MDNALRRAWHRFQALDPRLVDGLLVLALTTAVVGEFLHDGIAPLKLVPLLGTTLPLLWRRRYPIVAYLLQGAALAVFDAPPLVSSLVAFFFGTYSMGLYSRHRWRSLVVPVGQAAILAAVGIPLHFYTPALPAWVAVLVVGEGMWLAGNSVRALDERARRLERERELVTQMAVAEEQARIARELHDVIAHSVSLMVVQAGAARASMLKNPERATQALQTVEVSGREALAELRHLLGVLGDADGSAELTARAGLEQLGTLVERLRQTDFPVEVRREGTARPLPPGLDLAAYRIVQEALTNAFKHAGGAATRVLVRFGERELSIEVVNAAGQAGPNASGAGRGLLGMKQRVAVYGGELEAGPRPEGGFTLRASFPLEQP